MKRIIVIPLLAILFITSCKKEELNLYPYNQVETSQAFNTQGDVTLAVNGMYQGVRGSGTYYNGAWNIAFDIMADNLILNQQGRLSRRVLSEWRYNANNITTAEVFPFFAGAYTIIRRANAILENINKFPAGAFRDNVTGEALAMRALIHFDLSRVFSKIYVNASATDFTVPYVTTTDPTITPSNITVRELYDNVIQDLTQAYALVGDGNGIFRFNKNSVQGVLSRVLLNKGDYAAVIQASNLALGATPEIGTLANFSRIWTDESNAGVLFKIANTSLDNVNTQGVNYFQIVGGQIKSEYNVDYNLFQEFSNNDIRKTAYTQTSLFNGVNYNHVIKYRGRPGGALGVLDAKVIRSAEVLLNRAEAYYRTGNQASALADLLTLKRNRYSGYVDEVLAGTALLDEILRQRRLELAFEGDRFFDLKRRNLPVQRDGTKGDRADGTGITYVFLSLPATDHKFQLPYPQVELNFNTNMRQNPGY